MIDENDPYEKFNTPENKFDQMDRQKDEAVYTPPSALTLTDKMKDRMREQGFYLKWRRFRLGSSGLDTKNIRKALHPSEGYSFCTPEDFPPDELILLGEVEKYGDTSIITNGDLVLMKVRVEKAEARRKYFADKTKAQSDAINQRLAENNIDGSQTRSIVRTGKTAHFSTNT